MQTTMSNYHSNGVAIASGGGVLGAGSGSTSPEATIHNLPKFTVEDELREMSTLTPHEIVKVESDLMGVTATFDTMAVRDQDQKQRSEQHRRSEHSQQQGWQQSEKQSEAVREVEEQHLRRLQIELNRILPTDRVAYTEACSVPAQLSSGESSCRNEALGINTIGRARHMAYLECCSFDAAMAAKRIVQYWEERLNLFGAARAFLSMTLHGVMKDEVEWMMATSSTIILPQRDERGRTVIFGDPSRKDMSIYDSRRQAMTMWYLLETIVQDETYRRCGLVILTSAKYSQGSSMDVKLASWCRRFIGDIFPITLRSCHYCHPSKVAYYVMYPVLKFLMGREVRLRFKSHYGSDEAVLCQLEGYGLKRDILPTELCGSVEIDIKKWIHERLAHEYAAAIASATTSEATGTDGTNAAALTYLPAESSTSCASSAHQSVEASSSSSSTAESSTTESGKPEASVLAWRELKFKAGRNSQRSDQELKGISEPQFRKRSAPSTPSDTASAAAASAGSNQKKAAVKGRRKSQLRLNRKPKKDLSGLEQVLNDYEAPKDGKNKVGRKADPRMNRAVRIKLRNPDLTPFDALIQGGYDYPRPERGSSAHEIYDAEEISLHQRKNQLCRRVRQLRQKQLKGIDAKDEEDEAAEAYPV